MGIVIKIDWQHVAMATGSAFLGGAVAYLDMQNPGTLVHALTTGATLVPIAKMAAASGAIGVVALAKKSFLQQGPGTPPPSPPGKTEFLPRSVPPPPPAEEAVVLTFPKPPKTMLLGALLLGACTPAPGQPGPTDIAIYERDQLVCVDQADSRAEADMCRRGDHAVWCSRWPNAINCPTDAGGQ